MRFPSLRSRRAARVAPGKWSVRFILHHLAESETVLNDRIRRVLSEPRQVRWVYDQDEGAKGLDYEHRARRRMAHPHRETNEQAKHQVSTGPVIDLRTDRPIGERLTIGVLAVLLSGVVLTGVRSDAGAAQVRGSCFLLYASGVGEVRRNPATTCGVRVSPQSTFKIPHALAALDANVISNADVQFKYDGRAVDFPTWRRDHSLGSAMRFSVLWVFQEIATRLGEQREREYLDRFDYGNRDTTGGLTTFWLGRSLTISPEEQVTFLRKLYEGRLDVTPEAATIVRQILIQPPGKVTNALGEHAFAAPWPAGTVVSAKTGSGPTGDGGAVRWLVGRVERGARSWIFASNVVGDSNLLPLAAIEQAERALIAEHVLR